LRKKWNRNVFRFNSDRNVAQQPNFREIKVRFMDPAAIAQLFKLPIRENVAQKVESQRFSVQQQPKRRATR
jgi:hypothetical protein